MRTDTETIKDELAEDFLAELRDELAAGVQAPPALMMIAMIGRLGKVPRSLLTEAALLQTESEGFNCLHWAARTGCLNALPEEFQTAEYYCRPDDFGQTVFHYAAENGHLNQIAGHLLTPEHLLKPDRRALCPLLLAVEKGCTDQIPVAICSPEIFAAAKARRDEYEVRAELARRR